MISNLAPEERETIIRFDDTSDLAFVYTAQKRLITKLKCNPAATLIDEYYPGGRKSPLYANFTIPKALVSFRSKRRMRAT